MPQCLESWLTRLAGVVKRYGTPAVVAKCSEDDCDVIYKRDEDSVSGYLLASLAVVILGRGVAIERRFRMCGAECAAKVFLVYGQPVFVLIGCREDGIECGVGYIPPSTAPT